MEFCLTSMRDSLVRDTPTYSHKVSKWRNGALQQAQDCLAEETPVALIYNGISHAVMLATPQDLEDFALGFSLSEGILQSADELYGIEIKAHAKGLELYCDIASERFVQLKEHRRTLAGKTGCGLCGAENLTQALRYPAPLTRQHIIQAASITKGLQAMQMQQTLQQHTGATHASAWVAEGGTVQMLREDVGRHNALDKLIGSLAKAKQQEAGFVITTSRASYEMVQKTASAGINLLVAISAPTGLAVRVAEQCGLTLIGFARGQQYVIYTHAENVLN